MAPPSLRRQGKLYERRLLCLTLSTLFILPVSPGRAQPIFGAALHLIPHQIDRFAELRSAVKALKWIGLTSYRTDLEWSAWKSPVGDAVVREANSIDRLSAGTIRPLFVVGLGNSAYDGGDQPVTDKAVESYAEFAALAATSQADKRSLIELWNEWNVGTGTHSGRRGDPAAFARAMLAASWRVRSAGFTGELISGGVGEGDFDWRWLKEAFRQGLARASVNGIGLHLYNHCAAKADRTADDLDGGLARFLESTTPQRPAQGAKVYITEVGWPTYQPAQGQPNCTVSLHQQALNTAKFALAASFNPSVAGVWFYELRDSGWDSQSMEDNFGLFFRDWRPKESALYLRAVLGILRSHQMIDRSLENGLWRYSLAYEAQGSKRRTDILWSVSGVRSVPIPGHGRSRKLCCGHATYYGGAAIQVSEDPVVIEYESA